MSAAAPVAGILGADSRRRMVRRRSLEKGGREPCRIRMYRFAWISMAR